MTDDESKRIILSRRARFIAAALASAGLAANPACGGDVEDDKGGAGASGGTSPAGGAGGVGGPQVCLSPPRGGTGGEFGGTGGVGGAPFDASAEPVPCLEPPLDASAEPVPCLSPPIDANTPDSDAPPQPCLSPVK
jgi:hypothetical protein